MPNRLLRSAAIGPIAGIVLTLVVASISWMVPVHSQTPSATGGPSILNRPQTSIVPQYNPNMISLLGDSRIAYTTVSSGAVLTSQSWFNAANARAGHRYILGTNAGGSGCRSDQFLGPIDLDAVLNDNSATVVINSPAANDFGPVVGNGVPAGVGGQCTNSGGTYPYTDNNGNKVTSSNVGQMVAQNVITACRAIVSRNKRCIITEEPGSTTQSAATSQVYDLNARLEAFANANPGWVYIWSYNQAVWNPTGSTSAIAFKSNYSVDGVHYSPLGADQQGIAFNTAFQNLFPAYDFSVANENFINGTTPLSIVNNPLFTTLTGGTSAGCGTITGSIPSGWEISCHNSATTVTVTSASDPNGYGNDITLAITTTGADSGVSFFSVGNNAQWSASDYIQGGVDISVTGTPSNACLYFATQMVTSGGNSQQYDMYPNSTTACPNYAYSYRLRSQPLKPPAGTNSFSDPADVIVIFSGAGSITYTASRAWASRRYIWTSGITFSGP